MKKKSIWFIIIIFLTAAAQAQITKNNWLMGGSFNYSQSRASGADASDFKFRVDKYNASDWLFFYE